MFAARVACTVRKERLRPDPTLEMGEDSRRHDACGSRSQLPLEERVGWWIPEFHDQVPPISRTLAQCCGQVVTEADSWLADRPAI